MENRKLIQTISLFAALVFSGVLLIVLPQTAANGLVRATLPLIGTGMFTAGLAFFLVEMVRNQK